MSRRVHPHPFVADTTLPPDQAGRRVCLCGLVGRPGDTHHPVPDTHAGQDEHRRRAGEGRTR